MPEMKRVWIVVLIATGGFVCLYLVLRETYLIEKASTELDDELTVQIAFEQNPFGWLDPPIKKAIQISNRKTGAELSIEMESIEWDLFFHVDSTSIGQRIRITDKYLGQNEYDYHTLELLPDQEDCFADFTGCGGFSDEELAEFGQPTVTYDREGFKR